MVLLHRSSILNKGVGPTIQIWAECFNGKQKSIKDVDMLGPFSCDS